MEHKLREYARLLVQVGLNPYPGQRMVISSPVECAAFARLCAREAYDAGCCEVVMNWTDDAMTRMKYLHASEEVFDTVPLWRRHFFNDQALEGAGEVSLNAVGGSVLNTDDPDSPFYEAPAQGADPNPKVAGEIPVGTPGSTKFITGGLESSGTDLANEISNMITIQRGYQANTRIVTVTDSMLEELVNMKR